MAQFKILFVSVAVMLFGASIQNVQASRNDLMEIEDENNGKIIPLTHYSVQNGRDFSIEGNLGKKKVEPSNLVQQPFDFG